MPGVCNRLAGILGYTVLNPDFIKSIKHRRLKPNQTAVALCTSVSGSETQFSVTMLSVRDLPYESAMSVHRSVTTSQISPILLSASAGIQPLQPVPPSQPVHPLHAFPF